MPVKPHNPTLSLVEPLKQRDHGRFAAPARTAERHYLPCADVQRDALANVKVRRERVGKVDLFQVDLAPNIVKLCSLVAESVDCWLALHRVDDAHRSLLRPANAATQSAQKGEEHMKRVGTLAI
eukprot:6203436-Pleurochrysis_carterae.AAC.1